MAHIHLPRYEEMDPEIREKTGELEEIFQLLAVSKGIFFATDRMATVYLLKLSRSSSSLWEPLPLPVSKPERPSVSSPLFSFPIFLFSVKYTL